MLFLMWKQIFDRFSNLEIFTGLWKIHKVKLIDKHFHLLVDCPTLIRTFLGQLSLGNFLVYYSSNLGNKGFHLVVISVIVCCNPCNVHNNMFYRIPATRLAFSILVHENIAIFETLLHLIFRRQHAICVHVDLKAPRDVHLAVKGIIRCFKVTQWEQCWSK